jgi:7,8-dihydropterin-6-yl-methyl-4-(beta-D-ribofuranosyl)aminobenzene 5'-phosphate synthase
MKTELRITCLVNDCVMLYQKFWGEHGLAFLVETGDDTVLFDTGTSPEILAHNLEVLEKDVGDVHNIVLSHGHTDHTGALDWALTHTGRPRVIAAPGIFTGKFSTLDGSFSPIGMLLSREELEKRSQLTLTEEPFTVAAGIVLTGDVPRRNNYELPDNRMMIEQGEGYVVDTFVDDRSLVLDTPEGLVLLAGCCHAGIINTLDYVRDTFDKPVRAIVGGIHMKGASEERTNNTIETIRTNYPTINAFYLNHCTGDEAVKAFEAAFGDQVCGCPAGFEIVF